MTPRHFLTLHDLSTEELNQVIARAIELKEMQRNKVPHTLFPQYVLGMIFEKSSTRTRVSFEAGISQFGGSAIFLSPRDTQLGRGEPIEDSARVLSRMVDIIMIRTFEHDKIEAFAAHSKVPVINALTDDYHPCQLLADIQTYVEQRGSIKGKTVTWVGDGNNMCHSYMNASQQFGFQLRVACPKGFEPPLFSSGNYDDCVSITSDIQAAVTHSDLVVTDVWASMGQEEEQQERSTAFKEFQVSPKLMDLANTDALFMHCLPAHRGEEISEDMLNDHRSMVWEEAENRLHAQKALMEFLLTQMPS